MDLPRSMGITAIHPATPAIPPAARDWLGAWCVSELCVGHARFASARSPILHTLTPVWTDGQRDRQSQKHAPAMMYDASAGTVVCRFSSRSVAS